MSNFWNTHSGGKTAFIQFHSSLLYVGLANTIIDIDVQMIENNYYETSLLQVGYGMTKKAAEMVYNKAGIIFTTGFSTWRRPSYCRNVAPSFLC